MLEKSLKSSEFFCDSHCHLTELAKKSTLKMDFNWIGCCNLMNEEDYNSVDFNFSYFLSYGIHPQSVMLDSEQQIEKNILFLEELLENESLQEKTGKKINAVGEIGFDFYNPEDRKFQELQEKYFVQQLELALKYKKNIVIHCRKGNDLLFKYANQLSNIKAVLFHSFMGPYVEAEKLINKGIRSFFSFGKQILNNNKKAIECVTKLPIENLLLETDAPYQTLKNESFTSLEDIKLVYKKAYELRNEGISFSEFSNILLENLLYLYHE